MTTWCWISIVVDAAVPGRILDWRVGVEQEQMVG